MKTPDFSKLNHWLVNAPMHFYTETKDDGTEVLRHIRVQQKNFEVPADGVTIDIVPPDSVGPEQIKTEAVGSAQIKDGGVEMEDLAPGVKANMAERVSQDDLARFQV